MPTSHKTVEERFWTFVAKSDEKSCWLWLGYKLSSGYGTFRLESPRRKILAHRWMWQIFHGPIPEGLNVCHHCDKPQCVNPSHLFLGTQTDNMQDAVRKQRMPKGEQHYSTRLTSEDIMKIRAAKGLTRQVDLAAQFHVTRESISAIQRYRTWKHI